MFRILISAIFSFSHKTLGTPFFNQVRGTRLSWLMVPPFSIMIIFFWSCGDSGPGSGNNSMSVMPEIILSETQVIERDEDFEAQIELKLSVPTDVPVSVKVETASKTAVAGEDFVALSQVVEISAGQVSKMFSIEILHDGKSEIEESFLIVLSNPENGTLKFDKSSVVITDNDPATYTEEGYATDVSLPGYDLEWSDEFDGTLLDESSWTYELGNGCEVGICGWGNNEEQLYTKKEENVKLRDGKLVITARVDSPYSSTRIITKDKREFKFGRIDIRAKLPKGQGIWPAIWMLGANIDDVSWPSCGEIDIMELVGHEAKKSHGTAHWGNAGEGSQFQGNSFSLSEEFAERFHVFSLLWENNSMKWYVDETLFHTINTTNTSGYNYPFNNDFFFIMNVAVGGNWPGSPDETTVFPQSMEVDYIRVFKEN